jgi:ABC-type nickel/cobalt efflux system permease component RcnA
MKPANNRSSRQNLSRALMLLGALLMLSVPAAFVVLAFARATDAAIPGTLLILSATAGMALVGVGAVLYD